jgi:3-deoxy-D-manno-octulosonic-acid transferase
VSLLAGAYARATALLAPALGLHLRRRARRGKEIPARLAERRGAGADRPPGRLAWLHAASVGETLSILPLLEALAAGAPDVQFLVTTATVTGAETLAARLPATLSGRVRHRFLPLDVPGWVARFLDDWRPEFGVMVESELWPNLILGCGARGIPLALVNARFTPRSAARWRRAPGFARALAACFRFATAQTAEDAARLRAWGFADVRTPGNLKDAAAPLPADAAQLDALRAAIGARPVFLAASTRPGEEPIVLDAAARLRARLPDLLTILVPRHPERGAAIAALASPPLPRRSAGALPRPDSPVYLADTLGELGLFYRLAGVALIGGALVPLGGQNPREAAKLGCPILIGPHHFNFQPVVAALLAAGGAVLVHDAATLADAAGDVLTKIQRARALAAAAAAALADEAGLPGRIAGWLLDLLPGQEAGSPAGDPARTPGA